MDTINILPIQRGDRLETSESDVSRRQILKSKVDPRAERSNIAQGCSKCKHQILSQFICP